jgi:hypothetical protein
MARFLNNLKQKTVAGSRGPSSSELQSAGETIFLENPNIPDLEELIMVQKAHAYQTQNGAGLPHPGLSQIESTSIPDSGAHTAIVSPTNYQVFNVVAITLKNASGSDASVQVNLTDGSSAVTLAAGTVGDGGELPIITPLNMTSALGAGSASSGIMVDSSLYLTVASNQNIVANVAYQVLSVA